MIKIINCFIDYDQIASIAPYTKTGDGSLISLKNGHSIRFTETPEEIMNEITKELMRQ